MNSYFDPRSGAAAEPFKSEAKRRAHEQISASPFAWRDPTEIPRRQWLYPGTYVRKFVTGTIAPGGVGKTGLGLIELLSMLTGRDLLGDGFRGDPLRGWYWNGEDPLEEMERQVHAALIHYGIKPEDIGDRLYVDSGRKTPIKVVHSDRMGSKADVNCLNQITNTIRRNRIDVAIFDPLVSIHGAPENSNEAMAAVVNALAQIANDTNCAIGVMAHTRKHQSGASGELSAEDARGGKALVDGARVVRVLNRMTRDEGERAGITGNVIRRYFWVGSDKINLTPPATKKSWRYLDSVPLPNGGTGFEGDNMRVVTAWHFPNAFDNVTASHVEKIQAAIQIPPADSDFWRKDIQSDNWAGHLVAQVLGVSTSEPAGKQAAKTVLKTWLENGVLRVESMICPGRKRRACVFAGEAVL
jgi:hypothetical protein